MTSDARSKAAATAAEKIEKYEEEVKNLQQMTSHLAKERKHLNYLLIGAVLSPLGAFYKPVLGAGLVALFLTLFFTGLYFNFVHRNERALHLENAEDELERLKLAETKKQKKKDAEPT
jgi:hypothetical protein